jgi:LmbE family N-acetylglucosaminyl deacetylase
MVLQIRLLRPDVIITNHDTTSGHGHHQATGRTVLLAFDAAADPKQFPEQLSQAGVWQVQRLFVRSRAQTDTGQFVTLDPNENRSGARHELRAAGTRRTAQNTRRKAPGPRRFPAGGARPIRYNLVRQAPSAPALPANAKTPLDGLTLPAAVAEKLTTAHDRPANR